MAETSQMLGQKINKKNEPAFASSVAFQQKGETKYLNYTAIPKTDQEARQRIVQLTTTREDPVEPPRHKHKRIPGGPPEEPAPIQRSPPRPLTAQDQLDWKVPPCISKYKNQKGYTIPLAMRLSADHRHMQDTSLNENHAKFADALYAAERQNRLETQERNKMAEAIALAKKAKQEEIIR